ncbi:energy transducer TonB [Piscinibacter sakaiensis]|nr:energy transducer TonB [Piscinibacter sakaiensis]
MSPPSASAALPAHPAVPPAPRPGRPGASRGGELSPGQVRAITAAIVGLHAVGAWALLQVEAVRVALVEAAPVFVHWVDVPAPPKPVLPPPPPPPPKPLPKLPPPPVPLVAAAPTPSPAPPSFVVPAPPPEPVAAPSPPAPAPPVPSPPAPPQPPAPPTPPAPPPAPSLIPASAVQFLVPPDPVYPRTSVRLNETGRVVVRVFIDETGRPRQVMVAQSSGFPRLDEAATAGVQRARFKPPTANGQPISGWALVPIPFDLEQ